MTDGKKLEYRTDAYINYQAGEISLHNLSGLSGDVYTTAYVEIIKTKEAAIREALIKLGWTPPKDD